MVNTPVVAADRLAAIGPYFAVTYGERPDPEGFRLMTDLYADTEALTGYARTVGERIGTAETRVAASTLHLGTASRLWSVALGSLALTGRVPDLDPARLRWRPAPAGPVELWLPTPKSLSQEASAAVHDTVVVQNLRPLAEAVHRTCRVSPKTLTGNAASALVGTLRVLLARVPDAPYPVLPLVTSLLGREPLTRAGVLTEHHSDIRFRRRSCCLYYRVPGAGTCGDCVLNHKERPR